MSKDYTRYSIVTSTEEEKEIFIAQLSDWGIEGFEEADNLLYASGILNLVDEREIDTYLVSVNSTFEKHVVPEQNWNSVWEANFEPVQVENFVGIRASFHPPMQNVAHEIVITPKMSFGTGHHATTYLVMQLMQEIDFTNVTVFDFGTGTGVLAILAEKLGANYVLAVDNDDWCMLNATENVAQNGATKIVIKKADGPSVGDYYHVVIANINKNIILNNISSLAQITRYNGALVLSGLLAADEDEVLNTATVLGLKYVKTIEKAGWIALFFIKPVF